MEKQHGKQVFNDAITNTAHTSILNSPEIERSEKELDEIIKQIDAGYVLAQTAAQNEGHNLLYPTLVYTPKTKPVVEEIIKQKEQKEKDKEQERLDNLPKNCTTATPNGTICPGGKCFNGKCKMTVPCYGQCCDEDGFPKLNFSPCAGGVCSAGKCIEVKKCYDECCDSLGQGPLPDNTTCSIGTCRDGGCVATKVGCTEGACCNEIDGVVLPLGFPCHVNPCQKSNVCSGYSNFCPDSKPVEDGTYCPGGVCIAGVCARTIDPESKEPECTSGPCCDLTTFTFMKKGSPCSNNPCVEGSVCLGNSEQCPPPDKKFNKPNGSKCPRGKCYEGLCEPIVECEPGECCRGGKKLSNYTTCSVGKCFLGKCEYDQVCLGECCNEDKTAPIENGAPCTGGICVSGRCRVPPPCLGDCCVPSKTNVPLPDGRPCNKGLGQCQSGLCVTNITCTQGQCCNEFHHRIFPAGFPCHDNPCADSMPCDGALSSCPTSTSYKPDGYPCPGNGTCLAGKCILPAPLTPECTSGACCDIRRNVFLPEGTACGTDPCKEQTYCTGKSEYCPISMIPITDGVICKVDSLGNHTCINGICEKPLPKPILPRCNVEKACCNTFKQRVRENGTLCAEAFNECMETAYCNGFDPECAINYKPDGSVCNGGMCVEGNCIQGIDPTDDDTTHKIHVHHTADGENELITVTTTRISDGSTFTKEVRVDKNVMMLAKKAAEEQAAAELAKQYAEKKAEKEKIRTEQAKKDAEDAKRRLEEEKKKELENMTAEELNKTLSKVNDESSSALTPEELEDQTPEHAHFLDTLDHDGNPLRYYRDKEPIDTIYAQCKDGLCCNRRTHGFFPYGHICGQPNDPCKVAICSGQSSECYPINVENGFKCPNGRCYEGECIKNCYGECCDGIEAKPEGTSCEGNGKCFNGVCVRECYGDCCEPEQSFAKPNGARCSVGTCNNGRCVPEDKPSMKEDPDTHQYIPVVYDEPKETELEKMWNKLIDDEHKKKEEYHKKKLEREKAEIESRTAKKVAEIEANAAANEEAALQAAKESNSNSKYWKIAIIASCVVGGFLIIVLIIVAIVSRNNKKKADKKKAQDSEYYYEQF